MKKYFLLIINLLVCVILVSAQNYNHEFGKTNPDEFRLTLYDRDSTAEAVVLYRIGKTSYIQDDYGFKMLSEMRVKIKVLTTAGLKWADISIPFYADDNNNKEVVSDLKGNTYNMENNVVRTTPLDCKNTFIEKTEENWKAVKFAMPDVKVGSVLEYSFQEVSPVSFSLNSWKFQLSIPVVYSEFTVSMVPFFEYKYSLQGAKTFDYYNESIDPGLPKRFYGDSYQEKKFLYVMKNVPASKEEPFIDCPEDNLISLEFQLKKISYPGNSVYETSTSWSAIIKELLEEEDFFGKYLHVCEHKAKDFTDTMNLKKATSRMKVERIVNFLKSNFTWDGEFGIYASGKINEFLRTKSGSVAQINLFLVGMLNAAGLEAYPLLISTRRHGKIKTNFASAKSFNYVMAYVKTDSTRMILDATDPLSDFNVIPAKCINEMGLIVRQNKEPGWLKYSNTVHSFITSTMDLFPGSAIDSISGNFQITAGGYEALRLKEKYIDDPKNLKEALRINEFTMTDTMKVYNSRERQKNLEVSFTARMHLVSNSIGDNQKAEKRIIFQPFCYLSISENPFKQQSRIYPINFSYRFRESYVSTVHLPDGYQVFSKPDDLTIDNQDVKITYQTEAVNENTFRVTASYEFKKEAYDASAYIDLKDYFSTIVDKFNEKLILAKK